MSLEQRCETLVGKNRGTIKYIGKITSLGNGYWVGIQLDEPKGSCDGSDSLGNYYFTCAPLYGCFVRPKDIIVGEFPPEEEFDMEEDMI